jgi:SAM-dependent methyltransferase
MQLIGDALNFLRRKYSIQFIGQHVPCDLCGSHEHDVVSTIARYFHPLTTVLCRNCGLVFTNPRPTEEEIRKFYYEDYWRNYKGGPIPDPRSIRKSLSSAERRFWKIQKLLTPRSKVLDIGAGSGEFVFVLKTRGYEAIGLEPTASYADFATRKYGMKVINTTWEEADFSPETFDMITLHHVLEHLARPSAIMARLNYWLRDGGHLDLTVPDIERVDCTPFSRFHIAHLYNFNRHTLEMLAHDNGFESIDGPGVTSTAVILKKISQPRKGTISDPANYRRLNQFFTEHTNVRHFLSPYPYTSFLRRFRRYIDRTST